MKNGKVKIRLEDHIEFLLYKSEAGKFQLKAGDELKEEQWLYIKTEILQKRAKKRAMHLLEKMDRSEKQLRDKLKEGMYPADVMDAAIDYVKSYHYIDDERYARNLIRYQQEKKSRLQMKMDLLKRGISSEIIDNAMEEECQVSSEDLILKLLEKKGYQRGCTDDSQRRKIYNFLLRKGFRSDEISRCMGLHQYD
ncbi:recombination regulator RecX [Brotonthovivens ammoniilytica]|uniref:Regulatory protein RecX n=1 Tax=Brotonthovivens ammoniilytica TaxID=2981725 RepID=A0ABT2THD0_9FIRM|nr:regulatory protein RecX [Brotonthovivens ammoniilytica]MCU6760979.1 recombination regulator RecX [Brotonthovivens ammoniilytica]